MTNQGTINGKGFYTTFGAGIENGIKKFEDNGEVKPTETYDWPERPGLEYSSAPVVFQDTDIDMDMWIQGTSIEDVVSKKNLFLAEFKNNGGFQSLTFSLLPGTTYTVRLKKIGAFTWLGLESNTTVKFTLSLIKCVNTGNQIITTILDGNG
jgi:hypothetical protein